MKKIILLCLTLLTITSTALAADLPDLNLITNIDGRSKISLDGQWRFIIDPMQRGDKMKYYRNLKQKHKGHRLEYDFDTSQTLEVPGDWNTQRDDLLYYENSIWYKKSFDYKKKPNTRTFIYFGAAHHRASAWLNRKKLGEHEGGSTPFNFEITGKLKDKDNYIVVKVNSERRKDSIPTLDYDWYNYGGLTRSVYLVEVPETFIQDYFIQLEKSSQKNISGWVRLNGSKLKQKITVEIPEAKIKKTFTTDEKGVAKIDFSAKLQLWSPQNPKLYDVKITAETDAVSDQIGFRTIETKGYDILLNGKSIFLRGICIHEEAPLRGGRVYCEEDAKILLGWAKELNCNYVRLAHYPHNEATVRLADKMGLLVWSEVPLWQKINFESEFTLENAKQQITEMITRDKNRASVIIWSLANETAVTEPRMKFLTKIANLARSLDSTRLLSLAMHKPDRKGYTLTTNDPLAEQVDILAQNQYIGWYGNDKPKDIEKITWVNNYNKPLIVSEFGCGSRFGYRGDPNTIWTEDFQEKYYQHQFVMLKNIPFLRGTSPWILQDFRAIRRHLPYIQDHWNRKGIISNRGHRKKAFFALQKFYEELKNKHEE